MQMNKGTKRTTTNNDSNHGKMRRTEEEPSNDGIF